MPEESVHWYTSSDELCVGFMNIESRWWILDITDTGAYFTQHILYNVELIL